MYTRLRSDSVATRSASGKGTPAPTIEARIRQNRSTSAYWIGLPDDGHAEERSVPRVPAALGAAVRRRCTSHEGGWPPSERPPPVVEEAGEAEQHPGRQRQLRVQALEEGLELRQHECRQHDDRDDRHHATIAG